MYGFKGQADYAVDAKGRLALPAKMRRGLSPNAANTFIMIRGFEPCLFLYPLDVWNEVEQELQALSQYDATARKFMRSMLAWAEEDELDGQGRLTIPKHLLDYAGIKDRARVVGQLTRIEVWEPEAFDQYMAETETHALAEKVMLGVK